MSEGLKLEAARRWLVRQHNVQPMRRQLLQQVLHPRYFDVWLRLLHHAQQIPQHCRYIVGRSLGIDPARVAATLKALPLTLLRARPIAEAISSAGGVRFEALDENLMLTALPGVFCAGEMLDWEAPTGGYLLTACLASGRIAGAAAARWSLSRTAQQQPAATLPPTRTR